MTSDPREEGGDPACWLHLFDEELEEGDRDELGGDGGAEPVPPDPSPGPGSERPRSDDPG